MGDVKKEKTQTSWFKGIKTEFKKIIWPNKKTLAKETTAVVVIGVILAVLISVVDLAVKFGIELLVK